MVGKISGMTDMYLLTIHVTLSDFITSETLRSPKILSTIGSRKSYILATTALSRFRLTPSYSAPGSL
jgi:hypothetical protein